MSSCCSNDTCSSTSAARSQGATLKVVLGINAAMFVVELTAGLLAGSSALLADSLDMFGDALVYGFSLYAVGRSMRLRAVAALLKGAIMAVFGVAVLVHTLVQASLGGLPAAPAMGAVGTLALAANLICLWLLTRHRSDDINMRSVWLCSRNDVAANAGVLVAAAAVWLLQSPWPDLLVGLAIAGLFLRSAGEVLLSALHQIRRPTGETGVG